MELQINHPETCSYTVADVEVNGYKSEDCCYLSVLLKPRDKSYPISLTLSEKDWIEFVAETSQMLREIR